ncbi:class I SAM-dependent methyltransferase [Bifidobacterium sp. LC6]|uniref:Class I SAM-dependent methyltransferase n=1 Tax=Bifidobacterium colobi TaxID=2809026 RepID=A0ABS5UXH5_9BIFI|nr:class I SAM-dependent methyltransferase [Bifidobacterium colobi]MBT1175382.1 class I SAM-dependent methyltransferase [Bifidobacterium colobi]
MEQTKFHGKARVYAEGRPGYPTTAIRYIDELIRHGLGEAARDNATIADIGAGTGKFTSAIAGLGLPVHAVEPDADMRTELVQRMREFSNVTVHDGTADYTGLPAHSVDVITVAQAMHWFNPDRFAAECRRIACNGRYLLVSLYNVTSFDSAMRTDRHDEDGDIITGSIRHFDDTTAMFFHNPALHAFPNPIRYTRRSWQAYMDSHSHSPLPTDPDYASYRSWVNTLFDQRAVDGIMTDDTVCMVASELVRFDI